ncbi:hypothetical protein DVH05_000568 [Phytophthora capsici]|nr:hypothetical protein DVH05_000568 [Phytophthora capsici]
MAATTTFVDNTASGHVTVRASRPTTSRTSLNTGRAGVAKPSAEGAMARVVRDRRASGEEELSLRAGDIVKVLSTKRTGYLKCEAREEVGYVPSSYLEFLDGSAEAENGNGNVANEETQRVNEKHKKKHKKEKRKKEKREANEGSDAEDAPVITRSPRKETGTVEEEGNESPRRRKKKYRKHSQERKWSQRDVEESSTSARSRAAVEDSDRTRSKSKHAKKKRHRDGDSSDSSESDGGKRTSRHRCRRQRRRGSSDSNSESTSSDNSDGSHRRRRRRCRHRHRRSSSEDDEDDDSDYKRRSKRNKKCRDKGDGVAKSEEGARKVEQKKATLQEVEYS